MKKITHILAFILLGATTILAQSNRGILMNGKTIPLEDSKTYKFKVEDENKLNFYENSTKLETVTLGETLTPVFPLDLTPTVAVIGRQDSDMREGSEINVTFTFGTKNIVTGTYPITVANLPTGVTLQSSNINIYAFDDGYGSGTLTLQGSATTVVGTYTNLILTIDGKISAPFTLRITEYITEPRTVVVYGIHRPLAVGHSSTDAYGLTSYKIVTTGMTNGTYPVSVGYLPQGVSLQSANISITDNYGTLTLQGSATTGFGTFTNLILSIGGESSYPFVLQILPEAYIDSKGVGVYGRLYSFLEAGKISSSANYDVVSYGIANGTYPITATNLPTGVSLQNTNITITNGFGTLTLLGSATTVVGKYTNLTIGIDGITSASFTLDIRGQAVAVGEQLREIAAGDVLGWADFQVNTTNIADGAYPATVTNLPAGVSVQYNEVVISGGIGYLNIVGSATTESGTYTNLRLTISHRHF